MSLAAKLYKHFVVEAANKMFLLAPPLLAPRLLGALGARIGENVRVQTPLILHNTRLSNLVVGNNCHIGRDVFLDLSDRICLGDNVTVSMRCTLITHVDVGSSPLSDRLPADHAPVTIEDGAYLGANVTVLHGVSIGQRAIVGAGSLVRDNVDADATVAGTPARLIRGGTDNRNH